MKLDLHSASLIALRDCMGVKPNEKVLVITDEPLRKIGYALHAAARELGNEVLLVEMLPRRSNGEEPPAEVASLMKTADVVLCPASKSLTHTDARRAASAQGVRIATLPNVTEEIMIRCMNADYRRIAERTRALCKLLDASEIVRVKAPAGTDITLPKKGRRALASTGIFHQKGESGNLPTGEAFLAPVEGSSNGRIVVDGTMAMIGKLREPITIEVKDGFAVDITGGDEARKLVDLLEPHGRDGRTVAEFGIGTNDKAILSGVILEDEKVMGTIHIAFGDNKSMGGSVRVASHLDGLVKEPSVWFDDMPVMDKGRFTVSI